MVHGQDGVEVVERDGALHVSPPFGLNYRGFLGGCLAAQFSVLEDVLEVQPTLSVLTSNSWAISR